MVNFSKCENCCGSKDGVVNDGFNFYIVSCERISTCGNCFEDVVQCSTLDNVL